MQYKYLAEWLREYKEQNLVFKSISKFEDQYSIDFNKRKDKLHINLSSQDCFCFFSQNQTISFEKRNELENFNSHLSKARLVEISISESDRIITIKCSKIDIYNKLQNFELILELIPRYQNIILCKNDEGKKQIIDCMKKVSFAENRHRQVLPGIQYSPPQTEYKISKEKVNFPININSIREFGEASDETPAFNSINLLFEELYYNWIFRTRNERIRNEKIKQINKEIKKKNRKIEKQQSELITAKKEELWKQQAELLKANFTQLKKGMNSIILQNYYEEDSLKLK